MIKEVTIAISGELFTIKEDLYFLFRLELYYIHMFNVQKIKCNVILYVLHCHNLHCITRHSQNKNQTNNLKFHVLSSITPLLFLMF